MVSTTTPGCLHEGPRVVKRETPAGIVRDLLLSPVTCKPGLGGGKLHVGINEGLARNPSRYRVQSVRDLPLQG